MDETWQILRRGGLPLGAPGTGPAPTAEELATAVQAVLAADPPPTGRARDALCAFVLAWRRHWPRTFARVFAAAAPGVRQWAEDAATDPNRTLKLSRIATAHLASVL
ncbi:MAG TPA: hypothetical protein VML75_13160 [Kofleriaceae bacterium]|nr:hypothetical protein [Kofleriaceae bacterium]